MKKKLFIIGIGGLTGSKLAGLAKNNYEVFGSYNLRNPELAFVKSVKLDILNTPEMQKILSHIHPDILINASAVNSVDYCENHQTEAQKINIDAVKNLSEIAYSLGAKFIHLSSDSVFDGTKDTPYTEEDAPNPINFYGHTKLAGEKITLKNHKNLVVRASVLYGWMPKTLSNLPSSSMKSMNFGQWLITQLISREKVNPALDRRALNPAARITINATTAPRQDHGAFKGGVKIITDEYSSPIIADDFAKSILHLIKINEGGIFHSAPPIRITRYDFSVKIANALGLDINLIQPVSNQELGRIMASGFNKCLDSNKIRQTGFQFLSLEESLDLLKKQVFST